MKRILLVLFIFLTAGASLCSAGEPVYTLQEQFPCDLSQMVSIDQQYDEPYDRYRYQGYGPVCNV